MSANEENSKLDICETSVKIVNSAACVPIALDMDESELPIEIVNSVSSIPVQSDMDQATR